MLSGTEVTYGFNLHRTRQLGDGTAEWGAHVGVSLTFAFKCLIERNAVSITLRVHQHSVAIEEERLRQLLSLCYDRNSTCRFSNTKRPSISQTTALQHRAHFASCCKQCKLGCSELVTVNIASASPPLSKKRDRASETVVSSSSPYFSASACNAAKSLVQGNVHELLYHLDISDLFPHAGRGSNALFDAAGKSDIQKRRPNLNPEPSQLQSTRRWVMP